MNRGEVGCGTCFKNDAVAVWKERPRFPLIRRLIDEPHFIVSIVACPDCAQRFLSVFTERIDWVNGEDPTESSLFPLSEDDAARVAALGPDDDLLQLDCLRQSRRHLRTDWPNAGPKQAWWTTDSLRIGWHD
jgi:hypothetical protein